MTLEKLLIFGFAIAALVAITAIGGGMFDDRKAQHTKYKSEYQKVEAKKF